MSLKPRLLVAITTPTFRLHLLGRKPSLLPASVALMERTDSLDLRIRRLWPRCPRTPPWHPLLPLPTLSVGQDSQFSGWRSVEEAGVDEWDFSATWLWHRGLTATGRPHLRPFIC
jgi:hypothetical protein